MPPRLIVEVIGDTSQLEKSFKRASNATGQLDKNIARGARGGAAAALSFKGLGRSVGFASAAFLGGAGFVAGAKSAIEAASNLNEQTSKSNVVFGRSAQNVEGWAKTTVDSMGLAEDQALQTASSFGALLRPIGLTGGAAAAQSKKLTQLGADLASFYNTSVADALDAIRSGLVGEVEPLRRYGVLLSETRVQQEALNETGKQTAATLTPQEKVLARLTLIYKDTASAQGDFSRTSQGFANQTRILQANLRQLEIQIGQKVLPTLTDLVVFINTRGIPALGALGDAFVDLKNKINAGRNAAESLKDSSPLFQVTGLQIGEALIGGFKAGLGLDSSGGPAGGEIATSLNLIVEAAVGQVQQGVAQILAAAGKSRGAGLAAQTLGADASRRQRERPAKFVPGAADRAASQRNRVLDDRINRMLDRVQDIPTLRGQIAQLRVIEGLVSQQQAAAKDVTRKLTLGDQIASIERQIRGDQLDIATQAAADAKKLKDKEDARRKKEKAAADAALKRATDFIAATNKQAAAERKMYEAILKRRGKARRAEAARSEQQKVFGLIGLTKQGDERAPSRGNLLASLQKAQAAIAGTPKDSKALENRLAGLRRVLNTEFSKLTRDTKFKVKEFLDALAGKDKTGPATKQQAASIKQLVAGTGLSGNALRRLESNLAGAHLTSVPTRAGGKPLTVQTTLLLDGKKVASNTTEHQERDARRRTSQTRGRSKRNA